MVEKVARGYAKRRYKSGDALYIDECIAEAWFIVTCMAMQHYEELLTKYPLDEDRYKHYRMATRFRLSHYWQKFKLPESISGYETELVVIQHVDSFIVKDFAITGEIERLVVDYYCFGLTTEQIAAKLNTNDRRIKDILTRIGRRLGARPNEKLMGKRKKRKEHKRHYKPRKKI